MKYYEKEKIASVPVREAIGQVLLHDITQIVPDLFKGPMFKKGHIITKNDVEDLLSLGKQNIYVACLNGEIHENDAALRIATAAADSSVALSPPKEGKVGLTAAITGLLKVDTDGLRELNSIDDIIFATRHTNQIVNKGQEIAGTRIIPLSIDENHIITAERICSQSGPIINVKPFQTCDVGLLVTGSEVYSGRIRDGFGPVVQEKFEDLGSKILKKQIVSDDLGMTVTAIQEMVNNGAGMIAVTGGMSVDPDDLTPAAIRAAGGDVIFYGAPVLPGAMFMLARIGRIPVIGLPGCVMYHRSSIFDLVVPRLLAGEDVTKADIIELGHGGFCSNCRDCRFPNCSFGK